jgi:hypothetical protein
MIALVALPRLRVMLSVVAFVRGQGSADVDRLFELPLLVAADITFVVSGIDQLALAHETLLCFGQEITHDKLEKCPDAVHFFVFAAFDTRDKGSCPSVRELLWLKLDDQRFELDLPHASCRFAQVNPGDLTHDGSVAFERIRSRLEA